MVQHVETVFDDTHKAFYIKQHVSFNLVFCFSCFFLQTHVFINLLVPCLNLCFRYLCDVCVNSNYSFSNIQDINMFNIRYKYVAPIL